MKRFTIISMILVLSCISLHGQWYYRHHGVTSTQELSLEQFLISESKANKAMITGVVFIGTGTIIFGAGVAKMANISGDTANDVDNVVSGLGITFLGSAVTIVGIVIIATGNNMKKQILGAKNIYFRDAAHLKISPMIITRPGDASGVGLNITLNF